MNWFKYTYLKWRSRKPSHYYIEQHEFVLETISLKKYAKIIKLTDDIMFKVNPETSGILSILGDLILRFDDLAKIIFEGQNGWDTVNWNEVDGALAYQITEDVLKKNPKLMLYVQSMLESFGLKIKPLIEQLKRIMLTK